jgi:hypothetical protein
LKRTEEEAASIQKINSTKMERLEQHLEDLGAELKAKKGEIAELQHKNLELQQKARREQQINGPTSGHLLPPAAKKIADIPDGGGGGSVRAEFQQQREQIMAHNRHMQKV